MMAWSPYFTRLFSWVGKMLLIYACVVIGLAMMQRQMMYVPDPAPFDPQKWAMPELQLLPVHTSDGLNLRSWMVKPREAGRLSVVFFQGNGGHLGMRNYKIRSWLDAGYGVVLVGYRGYGNEGAPTEPGLYDDARSTIEAAKEKGLDLGHAVFYGESLGTGVAVQMALQYFDAAGIILEAPYTSMDDLGVYHYPFLPVRQMMTDHYDTLSKIGDVRMPLLVFHGEADRTVPVWQGRKVFDAANEPKRAFFIPNVGHNDVYGPTVQQTVLGFLGKQEKR